MGKKLCFTWLKYRILPYTLRAQHLWVGRFYENRQYKQTSSIISPQAAGNLGELWYHIKLQYWLVLTGAWAYDEKGDNDVTGYEHEQNMNLISSIKCLYS